MLLLFMQNYILKTRHFLSRGSIEFELFPRLKNALGRLSFYLRDKFVYDTVKSICTMKVKSNLTLRKLPLKRLSTSLALVNQFQVSFPSVFRCILVLTNAQGTEDSTYVKVYHRGSCGYNSIPQCTGEKVTLNNHFAAKIIHKWPTENGREGSGEYSKTC